MITGGAEEQVNVQRKTRGDKGHKARKKTRDKRTTKADLIPQWIVVILGVAKREGHQILTDVQYDHEVSVLKRLTNFSDAEEIADLKIEKIGSFYELKDKGGPLGKINLRLYFGALVDAARNSCRQGIQEGSRPPNASAHHPDRRTSIGRVPKGPITQRGHRIPGNFKGTLSYRRPIERSLKPPQGANHVVSSQQEGKT